MTKKNYLVHKNTPVTLTTSTTITRKSSGNGTSINNQKALNKMISAWNKAMDKKTTSDFALPENIEDFTVSEETFLPLGFTKKDDPQIRNKPSVICNETLEKEASLPEQQEVIEVSKSPIRIAPFYNFTDEQREVLDALKGLEALSSSPSPISSPEINVSGCDSSAHNAEVITA